MKRIFATLLSLVMVLAIAVTAFAVDPADYSITVTNAKAGETYTAYKMLDLSVDDPTDPTAYRYIVNDAWSTFTSNEAFTAAFDVDDQGYVTAKSGVADEDTWTAGGTMSKLAEEAAKYAKDTANSVSAADTKTAEADGAVKLDLTEAGYYVVTSTLGTRAMIETTPAKAEVTINEKNEGDTIEKTVKEDAASDWGASNDAQIGDTVEFKSVVTVAARSVNVKIHDTMDSGLTLNTDSIKVYTAYTDETTNTLYSDAAIKYAGAAAGEPDAGDTFTIEIPDAFAAEADGPQTLYIIYSAEVNSNAVVKDENGVAIVDQNNKTKVSFGDGSASTESTTTTTTHSATVFKHANGNDVDNLADAIFTLKKGDTVVNLIKLDATNYRVADDTENGTASTHVGENDTVATVAAGSLVSDFVTVSDDNITIWGLDSDGDYTITELKAPAGYNLLADPVSLVYNSTAAEGAAVGFALTNVANSTGTELPSTGGIGTTIFYIVGGVLVLGAVVLLVTRRRMKKD